MMVPLSFVRAPLTLSPNVARRFCRTAGRRRLKRPPPRRVVVVVGLVDVVAWRRVIFIVVVWLGLVLIRVVIMDEFRISRWNDLFGWWLRRQDCKRGGDGGDNVFYRCFAT